MRRVTVIFIAIIFAMLAGRAYTQPYLPPGVLNPGGLSDSGADVFASHVIDNQNVIHVVWASQNDYTGDSGGDPDIFYSRNDGSGWSAPVLVNSYGKLDSGDDDNDPELALGPNGTLHCIWRGTSGYAGTYIEGDIFYSQNNGSGWTIAEVVNSYADNDTSNDSGADLVVTGDGRIVAAWQSHYNNINHIRYSIRSSGVWSDAQLVNNDAVSNSGEDRGPVALATTAEDSIIAVWSTNNSLRAGYPIGLDFDIIWSELP